jgi:hypothetical protein
MIKIKIDTGNDAFEDDNYNYEVARILYEIAGNFQLGIKYTAVNDTNGNAVCTIEYTGKDRC